VTEAVASAAFWVFGLTTLLGALGTVLSRRILHSALFLVLSLASVAAVYVLLSADFLAAVQILVYTGAVVILLLFAIMLTPQQVELPTFAPVGQQFASALVAVALFALLVGSIVTGPWPRSLAPLDVATSEAIGREMLTTFVFPFELASIVLLMVMIGAILLARDD
jgi:NADH-quinone oxidoreductase subunit J